jgi:hypothetical protein
MNLENRKTESEIRAEQESQAMDTIVKKMNFFSKKFNKSFLNKLRKDYLLCKLHGQFFEKDKECEICKKELKARIEDF